MEGARTGAFEAYQAEMAAKAKMEKEKAPTTPKKAKQREGKLSASPDEVRRFLPTEEGEDAEVLAGSNPDIFEHKEFDASRLKEFKDVDEEDMAA